MKHGDVGFNMEWHDMQRFIFIISLCEKSFLFLKNVVDKKFKKRNKTLNK